MEKLKKIFSFILAIVLVGQVFIEPVAGYERDDKDVHMEKNFTYLLEMNNKKIVEAREGVYKVDLKRINYDSGYNYALLISWIVNKNTAPGQVFSISLPNDLELNLNGKAQDERGTFLGQVVDGEKAIINLYYNNDKINFYLTEEGYEASKIRELFGTDILLNINARKEIDKTELIYEVESKEGFYYESSDLVDEIEYDKLFSTEDQVIIEEPQGVEIIEPQESTMKIEVKDENNENTIEEKPKFSIFTKNKKDYKNSKDVSDNSQELKTSSLLEPKKEKVIDSIIDNSEEVKNESLIEDKKVSDSIISKEEASESIVDSSDSIIQQGVSEDKNKILNSEKSSDELVIESNSKPITRNRNLDNESLDIEERPIKFEDAHKNEPKNYKNSLDRNDSKDLEDFNVTAEEQNQQNNLQEKENKEEISKQDTESLQIKNSTDIVPSPRKDLLLITREARDNLLGVSELAKKRYIYTLRKTVDILDVKGMTRSEDRIVGNYLTDDEGKLVFPDLSDGRYTFIKEGEGPFGKNFTVKNGLVYYDGKNLAESIIDISPKSKAFQKIEEEQKDYKAKGGFSTIEIELVGKNGKVIDPTGAVYSLYKVGADVEEKIDTLTWSTPAKILDPKDILNKAINPLQIIEEPKVEIDRENNSEVTETYNADAKLLKSEDSTSVDTLDPVEDEIKTNTKEVIQVTEGIYILKEDNPPLGYEKTRGSVELRVSKEAIDVNNLMETEDSSAEPKEELYLDKNIEENKIQEVEENTKDKNKEASNLIVEKTNRQIETSTKKSDEELVLSNEKIKEYSSKEEIVSENSTVEVSHNEKEDINQESETHNSIEEKINLEKTQPKKIIKRERFTLDTKVLEEATKLSSKVIKSESEKNPAELEIVYQAEPKLSTGTLKIETVDKLGNKLFYGGTSSAEIGNLRDAALNHDATYGIYKKNDQTGNYEPLNIYNKMVYDPNLKKEVPATENGQLVMVNYKNGKFGTVSLDNLPPGDYVVKEIKSVFQYAFKNTAMKFTVGADGKITNFKDATVDLADYEQNQTIPSTGEVNRVKLTYNQKMDLDSKRVITETEVHEVENANINEVSENQTTKTVAATYHKGNLRVKKIDKNGKPIEGVTLELHGHDANRILRIYRVTTDANGIAEFRDLNVPSYHLLKEVAAPKGYALPNHQWMIYFGEGTWVEFDKNHKPKTEHIPLQISDNQIYATKVQLKPIIKLNPQETRQVVENDKYRPLIDGVTGASIAPKNWFQFLGINNPTGAPTEGTPEAETYWASNWNDPAYFASGDYEKSFNASKDQLFYNTRETLTQSTDDVNVYNFKIINKPRAKVTVNKKDDQGNILPGATFAIYKVNEDGSQIPMKKGLNDWTEVSGLDGKAIFDNIPEGNYVIKETKSPGGYRGDGREYKISVDGDANITFKDIVTEEETIYSGVEGFADYIEKNIFGGVKVQDRFLLSSKIVSVDKDNKKFTGIFYLSAKDMLKNEEDISLGDFVESPEFYAWPYIAYNTGSIDSNYLGKTNTSATSIDTFTSYKILADATNPMPEDFNIDLSDQSKYEKINDYGTQNVITFKGIDSPKGFIVKIEGSYDGDEPILMQGVLKYGENTSAYSHAGVKINKKEEDQTRQSQLDFNVTNTRDKATPLDNKGVIKLSKIEAGTSNLVGGAEFGLYVGKWDQIGERDKPFAKATTTDAQIGTETLHDGKLVNLKFQDLPPGTYTLKELSAPYGYEKTLHTWTVRVFASGLTLISLNPTFEEDPTLEEPVNVNDKITVSDFKIKVDSDRPRTTIYPNINEFFEMTFKTKMSNGIRRGNYFTIDLDEKLSLEGTLAQDDLPDMTLNGYVLATGEKLPGTNTVKYTFTEAVENIGDVTSNFTIALSPNRKVVLNDTRTQFTVNVAGKSFTTSDTFGIDYSGAYPYQFGGMYWLPDYNGYYPGTMTSLSSAFINKIDNENAEIQNIFYSRPVNNQVTARTFYFTRGKGVLGPNNKTSYELYVVNNPNFMKNPDITTADNNNSDMSQTMPRSFAANLDDTANYTLIGSGTMPDDGKITIPTQYVNSHLILKTVSPYDLKQERAYISVKNVGLYGGTYQYTQTVTTNIVTKPSKIFTQTDLTEGEVLAFNKKKDPMYFNLWKRDTKKEMINKGQVKFKMEVANDYPDSTPVPDDLKEITFDLSNQTSDPLSPLKIEIPAGMTGEYNLTETTAPKGYVVNGLSYRIKVDSKKRTVELISVKDSQGKPVEYKFKLTGAATESSLTATNPAPLYREQVDASGKIKVDTQIVSIDVFDPQGEFPRSGGFGTTLFYIGGIGLMTLAMIFIDKRKKLNEYMGKEGYWWFTNPSFTRE